MVSDPRGPVSRRPPWKHIERFAGVSEANAHVFQITQSEAYKITLIDSALKIVLEGSSTISLASPYLAADLSGEYKVRAVMHPDGGSMYFLHPNHPVYKLVYTNPTTWSFAAVAFTSPPAAWTGSGYPTTLSFFQGRSWWGGSANAKNSFWASKSASYEDLTIGVSAADGLQFDNAKNGRIIWISGAKNLLVGTENGEFVVTSEGGVITPSDILVEQQSAYGAKPVRPELIGNEALYVSPDGRKIRSMWYAWTESGWVSRDLTEASEHITENTLIDIAFARNPDSVVWSADANGVLYGCSYRKAGDGKSIIGWHRHPLSDGTIKSISIEERNGNSYLWADIHRTVNGTEEIHTEYMDLSQTEYFVDSYLEIDLGTPGTAVTGLDHLEGKEVVVIVDGARHPNKTVDTGGITLDFSGTIIHVGLHIDSYLKLLPFTDQAEGGSKAIHPMKRWNKIFLRVIDSAIPVVNGQRPAARTPAMDMDTPIPLISEDVQVTDLGWDRRASIEIRQDLPFALTVVDVTGEISSEVL